MNISLADFCELIRDLQKSNAEKAILILWYHDHSKPDIQLTSGQLTKILIDYHVCTPNSTGLAKQIRETKFTNESKQGFWLKPGSRKMVRDWLPADFAGAQPIMDHSTAFLSDAIWSGTNTYIEGVCRQLNGCYKACYFDAASVMLRRLIETLIIEAYEAIGRRADILDSAGNPHMLDLLINCATGVTPPSGKGLSIGREAKSGLGAVKKIGNRSAHNRRVLANRSDLDDVRSGARTTVEELIVIAGLKKAPQ